MFTRKSAYKTLAGTLGTAMILALVTLVVQGIGHQSIAAPEPDQDKDDHLSRGDAACHLIGDDMPGGGGGCKVCNGECCRDDYICCCGACLPPGRCCDCTYCPGPPEQTKCIDGACCSPHHAHYCEEEKVCCEDPCCNGWCCGSPCCDDGGCCDEECCSNPEDPLPYSFDECVIAGSFFEARWIAHDWALYMCLGEAPDLCSSCCDSDCACDASGLGVFLNSPHCPTGEYRLLGDVVCYPYCTAP